MIALAPACDARLVFAQMRAATGGAYWDRIAQLSAAGSLRSSGLQGTAQLDDDLRSGRYAEYTALPAAGRSAYVFDGTNLWSQDISGGVHSLDAPFAREAAVTDAYLTRHGYWRSPAGATFTCLGTRTVDGRAAIVIRVQPRGGIPAALSIDATTHLLDGYTERYPTDERFVRFADYRTVADVVLPFSISRGSSFEPANAGVVSVRRYDLLPAARARDFARPALRNPAIMRNGSAASVVPMVLEAGQTVVMASIDGHVPMPFILDTGGHAILTVQAAKRLGLHPAGAGVSGGSGAGTVGLQYAPVRSVRIGNAELRDQTFLVIPYGYSFYERGLRAPLAGILGLEFFERFAIRLDYAHRTVTLTPFAHYAHSPRGTRVALRFQEDLPLTRASADGNRGLFGVDTGNSGPVILFGTYLTRTGLIGKYRGGCTVQGSGTGGTNTAWIQTIDRFAIGNRTIDDVPAAFTTMRAGAFSSWTEAGNLGYGILAHFTPTFDYADGTLYLDATTFVLQRSRAGMGFTKNDASAFIVTYVCPRSAAARAGLDPGDRIVSVNGKPARDLAWFDLVAIGEQRPGTHLTLRVTRKGVERTVTIVLP